MPIRSAARWAKRRLLSYRQGERRNVALVAIRRGGSSLLADLIASQPGLWYAGEPFAVFDGHQSEPFARRYLPRLRHSQFFGLDEDEERSVRTYMSLLNRGAIPIGTARHTRFPLRADRTCLKILNAPFLTDEFAQVDGMQTVFLVRHPAAQARSVLRQGWGFSAEAYFERPDFLTAYLSEDQVEFGARVMRDGSDWQRAILNWTIETLFPLKHARELSMTLAYEELVLLPDLVISRLCDVFAFDDPDVMRAIADRPSGSSRLSTNETIQRIASDDRWGLVTSWRSHVDGGQTREGQEILDRMGVVEYRMDDPLPHADLCAHHDALRALRDAAGDSR